MPCTGRTWSSTCPARGAPAYAGQDGSGHALVFEYVVGPGDWTDDLAYPGTGALHLGLSALRDAGDSTILPAVTLPEPGQPNSLSHAKQIALGDSGAFVTTWRTTTPGDTITLPVSGSGITIHWGDGDTTTGVSASTDHTYDTPGDYTIQVTGGLERFHLNYHADRRNLISLDQWGNASWTTMVSAFDGASNMVYKATDEPDLSRVTDMSGMFRDASAFNGDISGWDVSSVTDMSGMFRDASAFNGDISGWDVSSVTDMSWMFGEATSFNQPLNDWYISSVTDMNAAFFNATSFNQPLNDWDVSNVTDMGSMFERATLFNQPLNDWDVSKVTIMTAMFNHAILFNQDISSWNVSSVTNMGRMFNGANNFNQPLNGWDTSNVKFMFFMFKEANIFNQPLDKWDVSSIDNSLSIGMFEMFHSAISFNQNLGPWFIVPNATTISDTSDALSIGTQNGYLDALTSTYSANDTRFAINGGILSLDGTIPKGTHPVTITADINGFGGADGTHTRDVEIDVTINNPPTAEAGPDLSVDEGRAVTLNGTATDPDPGDHPLTYGWSQTSPASPVVSFDDPSLPDATVTAPSVTANATVTLTLTVFDGTDTDTDTLTLTIQDTGQADTAGPIPTLSTASPSPTNASSATVSVSFNEPVDPATFAVSDMSVTGGAVPSSLVHLAGNQTFEFELAAPPSDGGVTAAIPAGRLADPAGNDNAASNTLAMTFDRTPPVVDAGPDRTVLGGSALTLAGSASDGISGALAYRWTHDGVLDIRFDDFGLPGRHPDRPAGSLQHDRHHHPDRIGRRQHRLRRPNPDRRRRAARQRAARRRRRPRPGGRHRRAGHPWTAAAPRTPTATRSPTGGARSWGRPSGSPASPSQSAAFTAPSEPATLSFRLAVSDGKLISTDLTTVTVGQPSACPLAPAERRADNLPHFSTPSPHVSSGSAAVTVDFRKAINPSTFTLSDLEVTGGGTAANLVHLADDRLFGFTLHAPSPLPPAEYGRVTTVVGWGKVWTPDGADAGHSNRLRVNFDTEPPLAWIGPEEAFLYHPGDDGYAELITRIDHLVTPFLVTLGNDRYELPDGMCFDGLSGPVSRTPAVAHDIDPYAAGSYQATYTCVDCAGNVATSTLEVLVRDPAISRPQPVLTVDSPPATNSSAPFTVTVDFGTPMKATGGYDDAEFDHRWDVDVTRGKASDPVPVPPDNSRFTFQVTPTFVGEVIIRIPSMVGQDLHGNWNGASNGRTVIYDTIPPVVSVEIFSPHRVVDQGETAFLDELSPACYDSHSGAAFPVPLITHNVDVTTPGTYQITYACEDLAGNVAARVQPVVVAAVPGWVPPEPEPDGAQQQEEQEPQGSQQQANSTSTDPTPQQVNATAADIPPANSTATAPPPAAPPPTVTISGRYVVVLEMGGSYRDAGADCTDHAGTRLAVSSSSNVDTSRAGLYTVTYSCADDDGRTATDSREVLVIDPIPYITLRGPSTVTIQTGSTYADAGADCTDNTYGDRNGHVTTDASAVDTTTPGTYTVTYTCTDSAGQVDTATRTVVVRDPPPQG